MRLIKKIAILSMAVLALNGCTKSSISNEVPVAAEAAGTEKENKKENAGGSGAAQGKEEKADSAEAAAPGAEAAEDTAETEGANPDLAVPVDPATLDEEKLAALEEDEEVVEKVALVEDEPVEVTMFEWDQVSEDADDLFNDAGFYPEGVKMSYEADENGKSIKLKWVMKNGTTEDAAMTYAADMVQRFNDILAAQSADIEFSSVDSFGGVWKQFALTVQVGTEDGKWLVDKNYAAGAKIDLKLPEYSGEGPQGAEETSGGPSAGK